MIFTVVLVACCSRKVENRYYVQPVHKAFIIIIIIIIITLFNEGRDIDYWSPSSFHNGPPTIATACPGNK